MAGAVQILDVATVKPIWTAKVSTTLVTRLAFGETEDAIVYAEAGHLRVATLPGAPPPLPQPSRFAGWLGSGVAAIEQAGTLRSFTLATRAWGPADRAALTPKPLDGAPPWARWVADAPGDRSVAAELSKSARARARHARRYAPIRALTIDQGGKWVFSADAAGEQRVWKLAP